MIFIVHRIQDRYKRIDIYIDDHQKPVGERSITLLSNLIHNSIREPALRCYHNCHNVQYTKSSLSSLCQYQKSSSSSSEYSYKALRCYHPPSNLVDWPQLIVLWIWNIIITIIIIMIIIIVWPPLSMSANDSCVQPFSFLSESFKMAFEELICVVGNIRLYKQCTIPVSRLHYKCQILQSSGHEPRGM